ncbi:response regulator transcription factor [Nostoc sp. 106C]
MIIEDKEETQKLFLECLKAEGFYSTGSEKVLVGVKQVQEQLPDWIICDITMPELDGYSILAMVRQDPNTAIIPLIVVIGREAQADICKGMEMEVDDYSTKPCNLSELLRAIAASLEKQAIIKRYCAAESHQFLVPPPTNTAHPVTSQPSFSSNSLLNEVFQFIENNYHQSITLQDVAKAVGYSPAYLTDLVKRLTGNTVQRWIIKRRMAAACSLLLETDQSVNQIAEAVGYNDKNYFFNQFRQYHGITPKSWRNKHRN